MWLFIIVHNCFLHNKLKYKKFENDLRDKKITREEAIDLVKKYDGKCSELYIKKFCDYIEIDTDEFWKIVNQFRLM